MKGQEHILNLRVKLKWIKNINKTKKKFKKKTKMKKNSITL
jgi:hypothetical protein